ncbi:MAG: fused MFS/spermidine synthase [Psychrobium sp.]|nr:fused MFS/spermidine synthase [Psychrobium sp.]
MLYLITIFLGASLLFMVQPIVGKAILPWFGGSASVWTTCMLFFQVFLLAGYCYAHLLTRIASIAIQTKLHVALLLTSLLLTPITISNEAAFHDYIGPEFAILTTLLLAIGLPYFVLASTGPLLQRWFSYGKVNTNPYRLYALSNIGSLLGLFSYPFLIEPNLVQSIQLNMWSLGYGLFAVAMAALTWSLIESNTDFKNKNQHVTVTYAQVTHWVLLSVLGVVLLLSVTNAMTQNIASIPFLWLMPLTIYLITFIVCFGNERWYVKNFWAFGFIFALLLSFLLFFFSGLFEFTAQILGFTFILLVTLMLVHGELAKLKPMDSALTHYYLAISFGGFVGGLIVALLAPMIFSGYSEFPLAIFSVALLVLFSFWRDTCTKGKIMLLVKRGGIVAVSCGLPVIFLTTQVSYIHHDVVTSRNFYGHLAVKDIVNSSFNERRLVDGTTSHGTQSLVKGRESVPLSYFRKGTGVELALSAVGLNKSIDVGVIGLGTGTLAAYGRVGDNYRFFELNPKVEEYAQDYFSYLSHSKAYWQLVLGDGRISLEKDLASNGGHNFDVLVIDAFSSDAIPVHLLTREALVLYREHVAPNGIIALHISNSHLDLKPLIYTLAHDAGMVAQLYLKQADNVSDDVAQWVLLADSEADFQNKSLSKHQVAWSKQDKNHVLWTDDFSNLWSVLKR